MFHNAVGYEAQRWADEVWELWIKVSWAADSQGRPCSRPLQARQAAFILNWCLNGSAAQEKGYVSIAMLSTRPSSWRECSKVYDDWNASQDLLMGSTGFHAMDESFQQDSYLFIFQTQNSTLNSNSNVECRFVRLCSFSLYDNKASGNVM